MPTEKPNAALDRLKGVIAGSDLGFVTADPNDVIAVCKGCGELVDAVDAKFVADRAFGAGRSGKLNHPDARKRVQTYAREDLARLVAIAEGASGA